MTREKILVTGSSGLIGTALCAVLEAQGHRVHRIDLLDQQGGFGDILTPKDLDAAMQDCTGVIHLAAISRVIWGERDPARCHATNVIGTRNVVDRVQSSALRPWLIFGSSREVYGQAQSLPVSETAVLKPMNHYARSKVEGERAVIAAQRAGTRTSILRFSTVYGDAADHADRVIPAFCRAAIAGLPLMVEGVTNSLDITHVADVAQAIADVAGDLSAGKTLEPLHLTTGQGTSLLNLAQKIVQLARSESDIITSTPRDFDVATFAGNPAHARMQIGWHPQVVLETGLMDLLTQFRRDCSLNIQNF